MAVSDHGLEVLRKAALEYLGNPNEFKIRTSIVDGSISAAPGGVGIGGRTTEVTLTDSAWTALPPSALAARNGLTIQNRSGFEMKVNFSQPLGYEGIAIPNNYERFYDIKDSIIIYGRLVAGAGSRVITIEEIA